MGPHTINFSCHHRSGTMYRLSQKLIGWYEILLPKVVVLEFGDDSMAHGLKHTEPARQPRTEDLPTGPTRDLDDHQETFESFNEKTVECV